MLVKELHLARHPKNTLCTFVKIIMKSRKNPSYKHYKLMNQILIQVVKLSVVWFFLFKKTSNFGFDIVRVYLEVFQTGV